MMALPNQTPYDDNPRSRLRGNLWGMARKQNKSIIDADTIITGNVSSSGALDVSGQIQGNLQCRNLRLANPGHIHGDVLSESVDIDSRVDGSIRSRHVLLRSNSQVIGDIHHESLSIESGAFFEGEVRRSENPTQAQAPIQQSPPPHPTPRETLHSDAHRQQPLDRMVPLNPAPWSRTG